MKPLQSPKDEILEFIQKYTEKAKVDASEAVNRCLDELRKKYVPLYFSENPPSTASLAIFMVGIVLNG